MPSMNRKIELGILLGIIGLISLTFGVSFSFFHYTNVGAQENIITSGEITFLYTETSGVGNGISLTDAYPMSDSSGTNQSINDQYFDFKITSTESSNYDVPYEVTARKNKKSTLDDSKVNVHLIELDDNSEKDLLSDTFSQLNQTEKVEEEKYVEKTLYQGEISANNVHYEKNFRLRMWVDKENTQLNVINQPSSNQTFTIMINVYSNGTVVMSDEKNTEIDADMVSNDTDIDTSVESVDTQSNIPPVENSVESNVIPEVNTVPDVVPSVEIPTPPVTNNDSTPEVNNSPDIIMDPETHQLSKYPDWGTIWGTLKIPDIGLDVSIYRGDSEDIIDRGIGHYAGSYFPGEGGSIILASHNTKEHFMRLPELKIGAHITIEAVYGTYTYEIVSTKIINDTDDDQLPIQNNEELLMLYTCYPMGVDGYKTQRYVVYAKLVG